MRSIRRWAIGVFSNFDSAVSRIENHDGLVTVAIRDAQEARSRARVQLGRVRKDGDRLSRELDKVKQAERQWHDRALRIGRDDEARAMECLRRKKRAATHGVELESQLGEHKKAEERLGKDITRIDERVRDLSRQRNLLRTRQSRAEALSIIQDGGAISSFDLEDVLDRWETKIGMSEFRSDLDMDESDELELGFTTEEESEELRCELQELLD